MGRVILGTTMSLNGYINDQNGSVEALYPDLQAIDQTEVMQKSIRDTGAVVMGRKAFNMAEDPDTIAEQYEYQVPIFVLTHQPPAKHPRVAGNLRFTFVTDGIETAIRQAKAAAGDKDVNVIGSANTALQCLQAGLADELHLDIMPVLLNSGLRMFEGRGMEQVRLERLAVMELPGGRIHMEFCIIK